MHTHTLTHIIVIVIIIIIIIINMLTQCSLSPGNFERGARGRLVRLGVVCTLVNNPRGGLCNHAHTHTCSLNVVCLLVTSRGVPGEGSSVLV